MEPNGAATLAPRGLVEESRALTGLRAVAALLVMVHHFYLHLALDQHLPVLQWLLRKGYLGVDLFFVLSGFVLCMVYGDWFAGTRHWGWVEYLRFVSRRVARLWPLHAAVLVIVLLLVPGLGGHQPSFNMVLANLAMIQPWGLSAAINPPAWSVGTEFGAYLLFPVLAVVGLRRPWGWLVLLVLAAGALAFSVAHAPPIGPGRRGLLDLYFNYSFLPLLRCVAGFSLGMVAWQAGGWPALRRICATTWFGPAMLVLFVSLMLGRVNDLVILPVLPLLVLGVHFGRGPIHAVLARDPLHRLGLLSYSTYLLHYVLLRLFPFYWSRLSILLPVYLLLTVAAAVVAHRVIEVPGRRALRAAAEGLLQRVFGGAGKPLQDRGR